jgi:hypothetical protein
MKKDNCSPLTAIQRFELKTVKRHNSTQKKIMLIFKAFSHSQFPQP